MDQIIVITGHVAQWPVHRGFMKYLLAFLLIVSIGYGKGLKKPTSLNTGFEAEYYSLHRVYVNYTTNKTRVVLGLWKDKASKEEGKDPAKTFAFDFERTDGVLNENAIYNKLKELKPFEQALDD